MNIGKSLTTASLIISLTASFTQAQMTGSNQRAEIIPRLFYEFNIDPNQPQAIPTSTPTTTPQAHCGPHRPLSIAWNKNSTLIAVGLGSGAGYSGCADSGALQVFDMSSGYPRLLRNWHATDKVTSVTFTPDGTQLIIGGLDDKVRVFELSPFDELQTLDEGGSDIKAVAINSNGTLLAAGGDDTNVRLYLKNSTNHFNHVKTLSDAGGYVEDADFNPINGQLAVGERRQSVRIYKGISPYDHLKTLPDSGGRISAVAYNPDGTLLASADDKREIRLYNGTNPDSPIQNFAVPEPISSMTFNREGTQFLVGFRSGRINIYKGTRLLTHQYSLPLVKQVAAIYALAYSPDGKWLLVGKGASILIFSADGSRLPTAQASTTEAITTAVNITEASTETSTETSTESGTEMDNSSTLTALSLVTLLTALLQEMILQ
ncbi:hypothetical protein [Endozoicomonas sp. 4G]|uniref:WD40 repeat domain-containing protein n=1 Tax=Endozoicomonas sp. 4G TaxID=2872754 RepID=UPI002078EA82|nr:hypothetical protein [Endozoicomonas sp. 4G]